MLKYRSRLETPLTALRIAAKLALVAVAAAALLPIDVPAAMAQSKFDRPVTVVVPFPPGGSTDVFLRNIGQKIQQAGGPTIVIDNKSGANGIVAATAVKQAAPDGHTVLVVSHGVFGTNDALVKNMPYSATRDFAPITLLRTHYLVCVVPASLPVSNMKEFVALARKTPNGLAYASPGVGSGAHIQGAMLANIAKVTLVHVPYRGEAPALADVIAGQVQILCSTYDGLAPYIEAKQVKPIAVTGPTRFSVLPDVQTFDEAGFPINQFPGWFGLVAPAGTPEPVVQALNQLFAKAVNTPEIVELLRRQAVTVRTNRPKEFADFIKESLIQMEEMVKTAGLGKN
jgi:tripartite-type tricarboxylate transporter receptor subunit TctC